MEVVATACDRKRQCFQRRRSARLRLALLGIALLSGGLRSVTAADVTNPPHDLRSVTRLIAAEDPIAETVDPTTAGNTVSETVSETAAEVADAVAEVAASELVAEGAAAEGWNRRETLLASLTIFVLAVFLGFELITKVPPTLHTPLMSGSNAISGITLVGALLAAGESSAGWLVAALGTVAVIMATVNAVGGFAVTHRMLAMFRRK